MATRRALRRRWQAILLATALVVSSLAQAQAQAPPAAPLLGYCVPPFVPPCVERLKDRPEDLATCSPQMDRYVASVFSYRGCLARETERAVRESNAAIAKLRCAQKKGAC